MIANGTAYDNFPSFGNTGSKTPPGGSTESAKYALGMVPSDTFPAEWANWLFHGATAGITRLNTDVNSIKRELNSVLSAYNITNDATAYNQLASVLSKIYPQVATCETAGSTGAKSVAIQGNVLAVGLIYAVTFTYANEYGDGTTTYPTFSINSGTAYPIKDNFGNYLKSGSWQAGETLELLFTGTSFITKFGIERTTIATLQTQVSTQITNLATLQTQVSTLITNLATLEQQTKDDYYLTDFETVTMSTSSSSPWVAPYDGFLTVEGKDATETRMRVTILKLIGTTWTSVIAQWTGSSPYGKNMTTTVPIVKGEKFYKNSGELEACFARYYSKRIYN